MVWGELFLVTDEKNIAYHKKAQNHVEGQTFWRLQQMVWEAVVKAKENWVNIVGRQLAG